MKILFIISETSKKLKKNEKPLYTQEDIHLGISYIASVLEQEGYHNDLFIYTSRDNINELDQKIKEFAPELILFSVVYKEFYAAVKVSRHIKTNYPEIFLLAGGAHITLNPEIAITKSFDAVCIGEGEYPILELVSQLEKGITPHGIKNIWFKTENGIEKNETRPYIHDLDAIPFPNRSMWQPYIESTKSLHDIIIGRGCPYNCTYCCNHALRKVSSGCYVRFRKPEKIIEEIQSLINQFPDIDTIFFEAEAINLNEAFLEEFATQLEIFNKTLKKPIAYGANIRLHSKKDIKKTIEQFVKANIVIINIGVESGSERVRKEILKRTEYNNDDIRLAVKYAKKAHRHVMLFVLLGIPGETLDECRETLELIQECRPKFIHLGIFTPYPGTELYELCIKDGLIDPNTYREKGRNVASFDTQFMTKKQIQREYDCFFAKVYSRNKAQYIMLRILSYLILRRNWNFMWKYAKKYLR